MIREAACRAQWAQLRGASCGSKAGGAGLSPWWRARWRRCRWAPVHFFPVLALSFPVLVLLIDGTAGSARPARAAFLVGHAFGFGYFLGGLWWIGAAFLVDADEFAWLMPIAVMVMPAGLALFTGLGALLARLLWRPGIGRVLALATGLSATTVCAATSSPLSVERLRLWAGGQCGADAGGVGRRALWAGLSGGADLCRAGAAAVSRSPAPAAGTGRRSRLRVALGGGRGTTGAGASGHVAGCNTEDHAAQSRPEPQVEAGVPQGNRRRLHQIDTGG